MRASHVLCVVDDLAEAVSKFEAAGFTVEWGNPREQAKNALIWFTHGPFIELLERGAGPPRIIAAILSVVAPTGMIKRFKKWAVQPAGWCEIALECDGDVTPLVAEFTPSIGKIAGPYSTKRTPPYGCEITTQTAFPHNADIPILMGKYRPNPRPASIEHANGVTGIESIIIDVPTAALRPISDVLDAEDPWIKLRDLGTTSIVREVTLIGLSADINPTLVCGAVLTVANGQA